MGGERKKDTMEGREAEREGKFQKSTLWWVCMEIDMVQFGNGNGNVTGEWDGVDLYLEDVAITVGCRLKDNTNDVVGVIVAGRLATRLHSTYQLGRQTAPLGVEVHRLPLLLLQQHETHVLVPVDCTVAVRVNLHEDLHHTSSLLLLLAAPGCALSSKSDIVSSYPSPVHTLSNSLAYISRPESFKFNSLRLPVCAKHVKNY